MSDTISRAEAIDAVNAATVITNPEHFKGHEKFTGFMEDEDISSFGKWERANGFNTALVETRILLGKLPSTQPEGKKGVFIPDITVEMLRKASLEAVEDLLTSGEMKDIVLPSAQPYTEEQIQKMQDLEQAQLEEAYRRGRESAQPKIGKWVYGSPVTVKCNQCGFYIPDWEAHSSRFCRNCGAKMEG